MDTADTKFDALRNAIYHSSRRRFFELLTRFLSFLIVVSGTAAVASIMDPRILAATAAVIGAAQLVFGFGDRARLHEKLQWQYFQLISDIDGVTNPADADLAKWKSRIASIYADEPPPMRALDAIAYNKACDSVGKGESRLKVTLWQWLFQHFYSFPNMNIGVRIGDDASEKGLPLDAHQIASLLDIDPDDDEAIVEACARLERQGMIERFIGSDGKQRWRTKGMPDFVHSMNLLDS